MKKLCEKGLMSGVLAGAAIFCLMVTGCQKLPETPTEAVQDEFADDDSYWQIVGEEVMFGDVAFVKIERYEHQSPVQPIAIQCDKVDGYWMVHGSRKRQASSSDKDDYLEKAVKDYRVDKKSDSDSDSGPGFFTSLIDSLFNREEKQAQACASNLKKLQAALEQSKMAGNKIDSIDQLCGPYNYIRCRPKCPGGGEYVIKEYSYGSGDSEPVCTSGKPGHTLPGY